MKQMKQNPVFLMVLLTAILVSFVYFFLSRLTGPSDIIGVPTAPPTSIESTPGENFVRCTMEVRKCPDGSYVGRVEPSCLFAPCPNTDRY